MLLSCCLKILSMPDTLMLWRIKFHYYQPIVKNECSLDTLFVSGFVASGHICIQPPRTQKTCPGYYFNDGSGLHNGASLTYVFRLLFSTRSYGQNSLLELQQTQWQHLWQWWIHRIRTLSAGPRYH